MFFPESDAIVRDHPDLQRVVEQVDQRLASVCSAAPLRPRDLSCALGADGYQLASVFELLAQEGVVRAEEMVECERCQNLMPACAFRDALEDEDPFECTGCHCVFPRRSAPTVVYRMTTEALNRTRASAKPRAEQLSELLGVPSGEVQLSERAQCVLSAMLELDAVDSDRRRSTEAIAEKALGRGADPNALKNVMAELKTRNLIDSKTGRGGGCWLTVSGQMRAEKLRSAHRNSATV